VREKRRNDEEPGKVCEEEKAGENNGVQQEKQDE
jgi:hypothetical protein